MSVSKGSILCDSISKHSQNDTGDGEQIHCCPGISTGNRSAEVKGQSEGGPQGDETLLHCNCSGGYRN
jgi:hypothetical protein